MPLGTPKSKEQPQRSMKRMSCPIHKMFEKKNEIP
jgi:hypothetical protein